MGVCCWPLWVFSPGPSRLCTVSSVKETDGRCLIGDVAANAGIVGEGNAWTDGKAGFD